MKQRSFSSRRLMTALVFAAGTSMLGAPIAAAAQSAPTVTAPIDPSANTQVDASAPTAAPAPASTYGPVTGASTPTSDDPPSGSTGTTAKKPMGKKAAAETKRRFEHFEITPTLNYTLSTGSDVYAPGGTPNALPYDLLRLAGDFKYRYNSHLGFQYQRITHTGAGGRTYRNGKPNYGGSGYDYEDRELLTYAFNPLLNYRAGYHYRARVCCTGAGDPNGIPRFLGGFFTDLSWRTFKPGLGGRPLTLNIRWEQNYHRFTTAAQKNLVRGDFDSGQKPTFATSAYANFYIYHQTKLVPYAGLEYFSTFFSNNPHISLTYRKAYGVTYSATRDLSYKLFVKNDQAPSTGDITHKSTLFLDASYRIHG